MKEACSFRPSRVVLRPEEEVNALVEKAPAPQATRRLIGESAVRNTIGLARRKHPSGFILA
jgi:hypothetical protein